MCTVLASIDPGARWPLLLAFIRDEDRDRVTDPPGAWWPEQPTVVGGHDTRAGGTWLAIDTAAPQRVALLTDQFGPELREPDPARSPTRGTLPLAALADDFDATDIEQLERYQAFHLLRLAPLDAGGQSLRAWHWDGSRLTCDELGAGIHVVASRTLGLAGEPERRARLAEQLAAVQRPSPDDAAASTADAWGAWIDVLDGRSVAAGDLGALTIHSVRQRPGFGTVGASLVGIAADGAVRYDINRTPALAPDAWTRVDASTLVGAGSVPDR